MDERIRSFITEYGVILLLAGAGVVFLAFGIFQLSSPSQPVLISSDSPAAQNTPEIFVDVAGAVVRPGLYSLPSTARVADAIEKAGGMTAEADLDYIAKVLNKAQLVTDGQKVFIPLKNQAIAGSDTEGPVAASSELININTASAAELDSLPGVGEVTAEKIIANRPYSSIEELKSKKSVTSATFEKIKDSVAIY